MLELQVYSEQEKAVAHGVKVLSVSDTLNTVDPSEMANFVKYLQKYADIQPRTYWYETPFYRIFRNARQKFCLGNRPDDLEHIITIEKRAWKRHLTYLDRLEQFPRDKGEYYMRLKGSHGVSIVRGVTRITGED